MRHNSERFLLLIVGGKQLFRILSPTPAQSLCKKKQTWLRLQLSRLRTRNDFFLPTTAEKLSHSISINISIEARMIPQFCMDERLMVLFAPSQAIAIKFGNRFSLRKAGLGLALNFIVIEASESHCECTKFVCRRRREEDWTTFRWFGN